MAGSRGRWQSNQATRMTEKGNSGGLPSAAGRAATRPTGDGGSRGGAPPPAALAAPPCRAARHNGKRCGHQPGSSREGTGVGAKKGTARGGRGVRGRGGDLHGTAAAVRVRVPTGGDGGCRRRVGEARRTERARCDAVPWVAEERWRRERGAGAGTAHRRFPFAQWCAGYVLHVRWSTWFVDCHLPSSCTRGRDGRGTPLPRVLRRVHTLRAGTPLGSHPNSGSSLVFSRGDVSIPTG